MNMNRSVPLLNLLAYIMLFRYDGIKGKVITCTCTTKECQEQRTDRCNTTSMCYTQYLERNDGSNPILYGCISSRTPLLCENRRPAVANVNWPILVCCSTNLCNQDAIPTTPSWQSTGKAAESSKTEPTMRNTSLIHSSNSTFDADRTELISGPGVAFNPMHIAIILVSTVGVLAIGIVMYLFCRKGRFFHSDCNGVQRNAYLKGHHQVAREDSELPLPLPRANGIYDNKMTVNT